MKEQLRQELLSLAESNYQKFSAALIPGEEKMLGVRLPKLREIAKGLAKADWKTELKAEDIYFEEIMLRGMVISNVTKQMEPQQALGYIREFIPCVKNWSVCDSTFMKMDILKKDRDLTWDFILPYFDSRDEFQVRVALIIMMSHLLDCDKDGKKVHRMRSVTMADLAKKQEEECTAGKFPAMIFEKISRPFTEGYYAHMAAAWLVAESFCTYPALTGAFLKQCCMDDATYNKALQKIVESRIPDEEVKQYIRSLKRKK